MKKISPYKKCPRCELNYIPREEELCDVCKAELKIIKDKALLSDDEDEILCPVCKQNYISIDDDMCLKCIERLGEKDLPVRDTGEDDWEEFADDEKVAAEDEELDVISLSELEEKEKDEFFEDEDSDDAFSHPDDFEDDDFDDDFEDDDFDDDEDYDDDEDIDDEDF
jgi:hypothetical protein